VFTTVGAVALGIGSYVVFQQGKPLLLGDGCQATVARQVVDLDPEQAAIAATIAGVGYRGGLPRDAVTVALATALQESHLHNVDYGDRDSVGIFQQRPSKGWGTPSQLKDPVYAATRFFAALVRVPGYRHLPVYRAAQAVQHSADGTAYAQYEQVAAMLSAAFTGNAARAVWCWYRPYPHQRDARLAAAASELTRTFGPLTEDADAAGDPGAGLGVQTPATRVPPAGSAASVGGVVSAGILQTRTGRTRPGQTGPGQTGPGQTGPGQTRPGWAIASWAVTHAKIYGIRQVSYAGYVWHAASGKRGWRRDATAPTERVELG